MKKLFKKIKTLLQAKWKNAVTLYTNKSRQLGYTYRYMNEYALKCSYLIVGLLLIIILVIFLGIFVW